MRIQRRWWALPVVLAVAVAATVIVRTQLGGDDGLPVPAGPVPLTQERVREALKQPPAPVEFVEFSTPFEENPLHINCFDRPLPGSEGATNALTGLLAGGVLAAPTYRLGNISVTVQVMRIRSDATETVGRLLRERSECDIDAYNSTNET
jgi:hypothetical protein